MSQRDLFEIMFKMILIAISHTEVRPSNKIKRSFFQAAVINTAMWMLTKHMEKKLDSNYTRILLAVLEATPHKTTAVRPPTTHHKTIQIR